MSHTIYGNTTMNGYYVSDMVNNNRDYVYYKSEAEQDFFLRLTGVFSDESLDENMGPALALFFKDKPYEAVYAERLAGDYEDYEDAEKLGNAVSNIYEKFANLNIIPICRLAVKLKKDKVADMVDYPFFYETDNQGYEMAGSYEYEGKKHFAVVAMVESTYAIEYQLARQIHEETINKRKEEVV